MKRLGLEKAAAGHSAQGPAGLTAALRRSVTRRSVTLVSVSLNSKFHPPRETLKTLWGSEVHPWARGHVSCNVDKATEPQHREARKHGFWFHYSGLSSDMGSQPLKTRKLFVLPRLPPQPAFVG